MVDESGNGKARDLGFLLGLTKQRISQLVQEGVLKRQVDGSFHFPTAIADYYRSKYEKEDDPQALYWDEKAIHERVKRETAEINLARLHNNVYSAKHVELVLIEMLSNLRTQLMGLPSKLAPALEDRKRDWIYETLTREIEEKLAELSEYSPALFTEEEIEENEVSE